MDLCERTNSDDAHLKIRDAHELEQSSALLIVFARYTDCTARGSVHIFDGT